MTTPAEQAARERFDVTRKFVDEMPDDHHWTLTGAEAKAMFADLLTRERAARREERERWKPIVQRVALLCDCSVNGPPDMEHDVGCWQRGGLARDANAALRRDPAGDAGA